MTQEARRNLCGFPFLIDLVVDFIFVFHSFFKRRKNVFEFLVFWNQAVLFRVLVEVGRFIGSNDSAIPVEIYFCIFDTEDQKDALLAHYFDIWKIWCHYSSFGSLNPI